MMVKGRASRRTNHNGGGTNSLTLLGRIVLFFPPGRRCRNCRMMMTEGQIQIIIPQWMHTILYVPILGKGVERRLLVAAASVIFPKAYLPLLLDFNISIKDLCCHKLLGLLFFQTFACCLVVTEKDATLPCTHSMGDASLLERCKHHLSRKPRRSYS